jgi:type IV pilus assembly protein PilM
MAESKNLTVLTLGSQRVGGAVFDRQSNGDLVLKKYEFVEMMGDPTIEATRMSQLKVALAELAANLKIKGNSAWYGVGGHAVFTRFIKLPPVQGDKADQLAEFEAKQQVPFDLSEVSWDYDFVNPEDPTEREIAIVAMKREALNELNDEVTGAGIKSLGAELGPVALFNSFRHGYADVGETSMIVDLGARSTNLIFIEGQRMFTRNILVGGAQVTSAIAKEFNITFAEAEQQKVSQGFISLGGTVEDHADPGIAALSKVIRNSMTRLHGEILRTVNYYRGQQGGSAPQRIFLAGGGAAMGYVAEFFQEKFKVPVEILNPLRGVKMAGSVNSESANADSSAMGELVGLALRQSSATPVSLELVPDQVGKARDAAKRAPLLIVGGLCLWALAGAGITYFNKANDAVQAKLKSVSASHAKLVNYSEDIATLTTELDQTKAEATMIQNAVFDRAYAIRLASAINNSFDNDFIWVTAMQVLKNGEALSPALTEAMKASSAAAGLPGASASALFPGPKQPEVLSAPADGSAPAQPSLDPAVPEGDVTWQLRLVGLYRKNVDGQQVVYNLAKKLAKLEEFFDKDKINVTDKLAETAKAELGENDDRFAYRFEIRLPLINPMQFQLKK